MNLPLKVFVREQRDEGDMDCPNFERGKARVAIQAKGLCETDGHYRCIECKWLDPDSDYAQERANDQLKQASQAGA